MTDPGSLPPPADPWHHTAPLPTDPLVTDPLNYLAGQVPVDHTRVDPWRPGPPGPAYVVYVQRPRRRRWPWTLTTLAALGALCCGVGAALTAPIWRQYPATVSVGETVAGLQQVHTDEIDAMAQDMVVSLRADQGADQAFAAVLADPADSERQVIIVGGTRFILDPARELDTAIREQGKHITEIVAYDPGAMGGELRCGDGRDKDRPVVVCAWIDHGSVGLGFFYGDRGRNESAQLFSAIRSEILNRG